MNKTHTTPPWFCLSSVSRVVGGAWEALYATGVAAACAEEKGDLREGSPGWDTVGDGGCSEQRRWVGHFVSE